jgi:hypothetical protein
MIQILNQPDSDTTWLADQRVTDLLEGALSERCDLVQNLLENTENNKLLPHTVALFGSWGSGKTAMLAELKEKLGHERQVIYFNAFKHAAFMEVMPALIYRLVQVAPITEQSAKDLALSIACNLVTQNADNLGKWVQQQIGINPNEIYQTLNEGMTQYFKALSKTSRRQHTDVTRNLINQYYTQVDQAQDALEKLFEPTNPPNPNQKNTIVVLIDELDRCDPGEAFDIMKQLRILFSMRNLPFFFVLAANPDPIGQAIQHKYGLNRDDYESRRILEKFVDTYIDLTDAVQLHTFIKTNWKHHIKKFALEDCSTLIGMDSLVSKTSMGHSNRRTLHTLLNEMDNAHFLYNNLRLLSKSMSLADNYAHESTQLWTIWHLILVKQLRPTFRFEISRLTESLKLAAEQGYIHAIRRFASNDQIAEDGSLKATQSEGFSEGRPSTPFRAYYNTFWDTLKEEQLRLSKDPTQAQQASILHATLNDIQKMEFLANLCAFNLGPLKDLKVRNPDGHRLEEVLEGNQTLQKLRHFGWLLANF